MYSKLLLAQDSIKTKNRETETRNTLHFIFTHFTFYIQILLWKNFRTNSKLGYLDQLPAEEEEN